MKPGRKTTKSGCVTCKARKVKCDENRPACTRCLSTGRRCEGYGIWGGGARILPRSECPIGFPGSSVGATVTRSIDTVCTLAKCTQADRVCFDWFLARTIKKIPGPFALKFWNHLLIQVCLRDVAVMHAVLSLSFVHKTGVEMKLGKSTGEGDQLALQHYTKAIGDLQPHFKSNDKTAAQITLITCAVFISVETLRGHFQTAETHLRNGLRILQGLGDCNGKVVELHQLHQRLGSHSVTRWIYQSFARSCLQLELLKMTHQHESILLPPLNRDPNGPAFRTIDMAWTQLEPILHDIFTLSKESRDYSTHEAYGTDYLKELGQRQLVIQANLATWVCSLDTAENRIYTHDQIEMLIRLLRTYHAMASVMAANCLHHDDEMSYDAHVGYFAMLVEHAVAMWGHRQTNPLSRPLRGTTLSMSHSMIDLGWVPPLYYTALKCRVRRIRVKAVRLLEFGSHREGFWDSRLAAAAARKVVEIEEGGSTEYANLSDEDLFLGHPHEAHVEIASQVPLSQRLGEVQLELPDDGSDDFIVRYKRQGGLVWEEAQATAV